MGLFRALRLASAVGKSPSAAVSPPADGDGRRVTFSLTAPSEITGITTGGVAPRIDRAEALQVPAVLRSRNLIAGSLSTLPLRVHGPNRAEVDASVQYLLPAPDPNIPASVVMAQTVEDMLFESVAWWRVTRFGWHGYPVEAEYIAAYRVSVQPVAGPAVPQYVTRDERFPVDGQVLIDGIPVSDREVIRFDSPNPPLLVHAARAIRTCLLLDQAAALYAKDPLPLGYFSPAEGADPANEEEIADVLDAWESARSTRAWGYVNGALTANPLQWNPEQLQLADARQHAVLEIARAAGVDPEDIGVSTTSRTYANIEQRRQDFATFTLGGYVNAIEQRLSMRDVLPRGYTARFDFGGFLRSDTQTRMSTYEVGLRVGAYTVDEIRELENRPPLPRSARPTPPAPPVPPQDAPADGAAQQTQEAAMSGDKPRDQLYDFGATFAAAADGHVTFDAPAVAASFRVNPDSRTITGLLVPWGHVGQSGFSKYKFARDSVQWSDVSRVKLLRDHDITQPVGVATRLDSTDAGLEATFKVARGSEGDKVLALAEDGVLDGLSAGVDFASDNAWQPDPADESVRLVRNAILREGTLTALPAFDSARVRSVAASREGSPDMPDEQTAQPVAPAPDLAAFTAGVSEALSTAVSEAFARLPLPQHGGGDREPVPAGRVQVTREEPVYTFAGSGPSLVRDAWHARVEGNVDARDRLRKFGSQQQDMVSLFARRPDLAFAVNTGNASQVIPPGYRPDLYVTQLLQGRPFTDAVSRGTLTDATPFVIPRFSSSSGATADHTEGTNPTGGSLTLDSVTVTPGGTSGLFQLTREIVDSSNPAIDAIAFQAMRESYSQQTEAKVYAELNGANGQGGTITAGRVPSGAQVSTTTGGSAASGTFGGEKLLPGIRNALAKYPFVRFGAPNRMHLSAEGTSAFAGAVGSDGRPLLPSVGAQNSAGVGNAVTQGWFVDGLAAMPTWSMTGNAAGDADVLIYNSNDVWAWESPLLTFRFEEKSGPALIELALFGYFATRVVRPAGIAAVRHTVGA